MENRRLEGVRIGCAMTGSFCTFSAAFDTWRALRDEGAELYPIMSFNAGELDTRFYPACKAVDIFEGITGRKVWNTIQQVEPIGPKKLLDLLIIAPCTGNTPASTSPQTDMHAAPRTSAMRKMPSEGCWRFFSCWRQHRIATSSNRASVADCARYIAAIVEMSSLTEGRCVVQ